MNFRYCGKEPTLPGFPSVFEYTGFVQFRGLLRGVKGPQSRTFRSCPTHSLANNHGLNMFSSAFFKAARGHRSSQREATKRGVC